METRGDTRELLSRCDLFIGLDDERIEKLAAICFERPVADGQHLFHAADPATELFVLAEGSVSLEMLSGGRNVVVEVCGPTQAVVWSALRLNGLYSLSARVVENGRALVFLGTWLQRALAVDTKMAGVVYRNLAELVGRRWEGLMNPGVAYTGPLAAPAEEEVT
ncbi:MAG: cyclic nucleotide-binding domain-containing protein [Chloroflexi bacterium]|nr:cyclic nucleotide-binding domain-containing protein [Chloroflexota bacterium]